MWGPGQASGCKSGGDDARGWLVGEPQLWIGLPALPALLACLPACWLAGWLPGRASSPAPTHAQPASTTDGRPAGQTASQRRCRGRCGCCHCGCDSCPSSSCCQLRPFASRALAPPASCFLPPASCFTRSRLLGRPLRPELRPFPLHAGQPVHSIQSTTAHYHHHNPPAISLLPIQPTPSLTCPDHHHRRCPPLHHRRQSPVTATPAPPLLCPTPATLPPRPPARPS